MPHVLVAERGDLWLTATLSEHHDLYRVVAESPCPRADELKTEFSSWKKHRELPKLLVPLSRGPAATLLWSSSREQTFPLTWMWAY